MRTIGILGGMSWESTVFYYQHINQLVKNARGGLTSAPMMIDSVDFAQMAQWQREGHWDLAAQYLGERARVLQNAGCQAIGIATNTMHKVAPAIESAVKIPLLHIADPTAAAIRKAGLSRIGLLGTRFTMEQDFYKQRLSERHGIDVVVPNEMERDVVHRVIYEELCLGQIHPDSRAAYRRIMQRLVEQEGVQAIILGCTEISLLVDHSDASVPLFDTTALHAQAAAAFGLAMK